MSRRDADIIDSNGKVRVLRKRCETCIFRPGQRELFGPERIDEIIERNVQVGALLTCHSTLTYGPNPNFGPAACAGFWIRYRRLVLAGVIATSIGIVRPMPPIKEEVDETE